MAAVFASCCDGDPLQPVSGRLTTSAVFRQMADGSFNNRGLSLGLYLRQAEQLQRRAYRLSLTK